VVKGKNISKQQKETTRDVEARVSCDVGLETTKRNYKGTGSTAPSRSDYALESELARETTKRNYKFVSDLHVGGKFDFRNNKKKLQEKIFCWLFL